MALTTNQKRGDMWICFASIEEHSTTPILGGERLVLSIGALVKADEAQAVYDGIALIPNDART